jgi:uncharacterized membrane protein
MQPDADAFEAVLYPNRSLGRGGFIAVMLGVSTVSAAVSAGFLLVGAWPVTGFMGLDVLLLYLAFRAAQRAARRREHIRLDASGLHVRRIGPDGNVADWRFEPYWVRVHMDDPPRRDSLLTLASHGRRLAIGLFLTPEERLDLARALESALHRYR